MRDEIKQKRRELKAEKEKEKLEERQRLKEAKNERRDFIVQMVELRLSTYKGKLMDLQKALGIGHPANWYAKKKGKKRFFTEEEFELFLKLTE